MEKGLRYAAQIGDLRSTGLIEFCCGNFFYVKGDWKPAIEHLQNAIKHSEEVKFFAPLAWSWALLGAAYSYLGDPEIGKKYVEKGLKIQRDGEFEWFLSIHHWFLDDIYLHLGDLENARSFTDELKLKPNYAIGCFSLGELYANAGQKEKAMENLKKAKSMFQEMGMDYWLEEPQEVFGRMWRLTAYAHIL